MSGKRKNRGAQDKNRAKQLMTRYKKARGGGDTELQRRLAGKLAQLGRSVPAQG